jgi:hypothetical protein
LVNTREAVAPWCSIDLSSGNLTVVLEPFNCFDAEVYADDLDMEEKIDFREDQRSMLRNSMTSYVSANPKQSVLAAGYCDIYLPISLTKKSREMKRTAKN